MLLFMLLLLLSAIENVITLPLMFESSSISITQEGRVLPCVGYTGTCRWTGMVFWPHCPEQGIQHHSTLS